MILTKEFRFEASHQIQNHPGKCARLHGHSWKLEVAVEGLMRSDTGMVVDFYNIKEAVQPIIDKLDHQHLGEGFTQEYFIINTIEPYDTEFPSLPTSENLLIWIANQLPHELPWIQLQLDETCTSSCILTREDWETNYAKGTYSAAEETEDQAATGGPEEA